MGVSLDEVKKLKEMTGLGLTDAKKALEEAAGDFDAALKALREKGLTKAEKRGEREAREGVVLAKTDGKVGAVIELNCETDFVARNEKFTDLAAKLIDEAVNDGEKAIENTDGEVKEAIVALGENIVLKQVVKLEASTGKLDSYVHGGRIGVLVETTADDEIAHDIALQVASMNPKYITENDIPQETRDAKKAELIKALEESGKPAEMAEKIVGGQLNKYFAEQVLVFQPFWKDDSKKVSDILGDAEVLQMARVELGVSE